MIDKCRQTFIVFGSERRASFWFRSSSDSLFRWYVNIFKRVISLMSCHKSKAQGIEQTTNGFIVLCTLHKSEWRANKPRMRIVKSFARFSSPDRHSLSIFLSLSFSGALRSGPKCRQNMCFALNENRNVVFFVLSLAPVFKAWRWEAREAWNCRNRHKNK